MGEQLHFQSRGLSRGLGGSGWGQAPFPHSAPTPGCTRSPGPGQGDPRSRVWEPGNHPHPAALGEGCVCRASWERGRWGPQPKIACEIFHRPLVLPSGSQSPARHQALALPTPPLSRPTYLGTPDTPAGPLAPTSCPENPPTISRSNQSPARRLGVSTPWRGAYPREGSLGRVLTH